MMCLNSTLFLFSGVFLLLVPGRWRWEMAICTAFPTLMVYLHCYVPVTKSKFLSTGTDGVTASVRKTEEVTVVSVLCDKEGTYLRWRCRYGAALSHCTVKVNSAGLWHFITSKLVKEDPFTDALFILAAVSPVPSLRHPYGISSINQFLLPAIL